jgi:hypothetical protein
MDSNNGESVMNESDLKTYEKLQRIVFRKKVHRIWNIMKSGKPGELSEKDKKLANIIVEHEEYSDHFENTDILDGSEYEAGKLFNPFFHISTHQIIEDQLAANSPIETALFVEEMQDKGVSRHEAIHYVIMILIHLIHAAATGRQPFDTERYKRLLTEGRDVEPSEIEKLIEADFSGNESRRNLH